MIIWIQHLSYTLQMENKCIFNLANATTASLHQGIERNMGTGANQRKSPRFHSNEKSSNHIFYANYMYVF